MVLLVQGLFQKRNTIEEPREDLFEEWFVPSQESNGSFLKLSKRTILGASKSGSSALLLRSGVRCFFLSSCSWRMVLLLLFEEGFLGFFEWVRVSEKNSKPIVLLCSKTITYKHHLPSVLILYCQKWKVFLIKMTGFEPVTLCTQNRYATRLRYILYF